MDALEFLKEKKRMCNAYSEHNNCFGDCPLIESCCVINNSTPDEDLKKMITVVEQWSKDHPRKTRQSVFMDQYPEVEIDENGVVGLCPMFISDVHRDSNGECNYPEKQCRDCRREFWMKEVNE